MAPHQAEAYRELSNILSAELKRAIVLRDFSLLGVVLNCLLRWPDSCFRPEKVLHPRSRILITFTGSQFDEDEPSPKESALVDLCRTQKQQGRRVLIYTTYTGRHDLAARYKQRLTEAGLKAAVLRASVSPEKREDWIADQVDRGVDGLICNPELVKTGLDLYDFPELAFMQTGFSVYTLQQASRRSWRIGQTEPVNVNILGYQETAQVDCLRLMAQKIAVSQSTSGEMPDTGLDFWNQGDQESVEVALARHWWRTTIRRSPPSVGCRDHLFFRRIPGRQAEGPPILLASLFAGLMQGRFGRASNRARWTSVHCPLVTIPGSGLRLDSRQKPP